MTGDNIKRIRIEKKLTQKKLGELCGIDEANLRKYENGRLKPSLNTIRKIAASLDVYLSDLIDDWSKYSPEEYAKDWEDGLPLDELKVLQDYRILNDNGKDEARKRVNELTEIPKYQKKDENTHILVNAAHARTDIEITEEMKKHDDIMNDENF